MVANNQTEDINQITKETSIRSTHVFVIDADDGTSTFSTKGYELGTIKKKNITAVSTTPYAQIENDEIITVDATSAPITVNLLSAGSQINKQIIIKKIDASANAVTIDANGSETIDGATTKVLSTQYDSVTLISNGTEWFIVA